MISYKKLGGAGLVALAAVLVFVLVVPGYQTIGQAKTEILSWEEMVRQKKKFNERVKEFEEKVEVRREDLEKLTILLPAQKSIQEVVVNVEEIARQAGVQISELKTSSGTIASGQPYRTVQIELSTLGPYAALVDLLRLLEKNLRIFDVRELTVSPKDRDASGVGGFELLSLNLKFGAYFLP